MCLVVQHTVRDYDSWKLVFDQRESVRLKYGAQGHMIHRDVERPNDVTVFTRFESRARAHEFARDPSLAEAMERGGVIGEPRIMWVEEADSVSHAGCRAACPD